MNTTATNSDHFNKAVVQVMECVEAGETTAEASTTVAMNMTVCGMDSMDARRVACAAAEFVQQFADREAWAVADLWKVQEAASAASDLRRQMHAAIAVRDALILEAHADGHTDAGIASFTGLDRSQVTRIVGRAVGFRGAGRRPRQLADDA